MVTNEAYFLYCFRVIAFAAYAVHGPQELLLKEGGFGAIYRDLLFLLVFGIGTLLIATSLFKRTL